MDAQEKEIQEGGFYWREEEKNAEESLRKKCCRFDICW